MKKILFLIFIILSALISVGQPVVNRAGPANTVSDARWKAQYNLIVPVYADTATANLAANIGIDSCYAVIATRDSNFLWYRQCSPKKWVKLGSGGGSSGVNIYNSDGTLSGTRVLDLSTYALAFSRSSIKQFAAEDNLTTIGAPNNIRRFTVYNDSITLTGSDQSASSSDSVLVRTASGRIKTRAQSAFGGSQGLQDVITVDPVLTTNNDIDLNGHDLTFADNSSNGTFAVNMQGMGTVGFTVFDAGISSSNITIRSDTTFFYPHKGLIVIDTVYRAANLTNKLVGLWDSTSRILQFIHPDSLDVTPTLQQVLATQSNNAVVTATTDISPDADTRDLFFGNAQKWGEIKILSKDTTRFVSDIVLVDTSDFWVKGDSITNLFRVRTDINKIGLGTDNPYSFVSNITTQMTDGSNGVSSDGIQFSMSNGGYMVGFENTSSGGTAFGMLIKSNGNERILNVINSSAVSVLRADKDSLISNLTIAAGDSTNKIPTTKWVKQEIASGGGLDSSYLFFDTTYNRLGTVVSTDTSIVKSLRIQVNSSTVTPTVTDSTINWDLTSLVTSLTNGLTLSSGVGKLGGALTENTSITNASGYEFKIFLDEDDDLQGFNGINYNSFIGFANGNVVASQGNYNSLTIGGSLLQLSGGNGSNTSYIGLANDTLRVAPPYGILKIDTLTSAVGTKSLRYNPTTGLVSYADTTTGGGGLEKGVTTIASSATRRILYDSSGILQNNGKFLLNANDELQINNETDEGDFKLQVKGNGFFQAASGSGTSYVYFESTTGTNHAIQYDGTQMFIKGASTLILGDQGTGTVLQVYNQKVYIAPGGGTGSARLEVGAGTSSVAPFALTAGTNKSTAQNGSFEYNGTNFFVTRTGNAREGLLSASAVNSVSPTSPNRTITVNIDGTTYYIAAKTTND